MSKRSSHVLDTFGAWVSGNCIARLDSRALGAKSLSSSATTVVRWSKLLRAGEL
jgi:hypothetical protein